MTHKISPISFRLGVTSSWLSSSHISPPNLPFILTSDQFLRSLIQGVFFQFSLFTSQISLLRTPSGALKIHLFYWESTTVVKSTSPSPLSKYPPSNLTISKPYLVSSILYKLISKLFVLPSLSFHFSQIPSPVYNAKILSDYLAYRISLDPYFHKSVVLEALRAAKI